jgi:shikimate kinase
MMKKIVLIGYMGSGKSTIAKALGEQLGCPAYDLDDLIEQKMNCTIATLFESKGELYFRKVEHEILTSFLTAHDSFILALGGGTPCYFNNFELYQSNEYCSFYLKSGVSHLAKRLQKEASKRPIIKNKTEGELEEFIAKHLFDRSFYYHQVNHVISTDFKSIPDLLDEINKFLT